MHTIPLTTNNTSTTTHLRLDGYFSAATTTGLVKDTNEDRFGYAATGDVVRLCIADGHWGSGAAEQAISYWLATTTSFPCERESAIKAIRTLQSALYDTYGSAHMDETSDFTPETSLIAVELDGHHVRIVSYGDCRLLIARHGIPRFTLDTHETWLGAFSHLGLRQRIPVEQATIFAEQQLGSGDRLCLYTDGVDECVYNTPTISIDTLATLTDTADSEDALKTILSRVFKCGAEDNATLAIIAR